MDDALDCVIVSKNASFSSNEDLTEDVIETVNLRNNCLDEIDKILSKKLNKSRFDYANTEGHQFSR